MNLRRSLVASACALLAAVAFVAFASGATGATTTTQPLVRLIVPLDQSVRDLVRGRLVLRITCGQRCSARTTLSIRAVVARRLGFKDISGSEVTFASKNLTLPARRQVKVRIALDPAAKKLLAKVRSGIQVISEVSADSQTSSRRGTADSITSLRP
jgi:hypothetical protein